MSFSLCNFVIMRINMTPKNFLPYLYKRLIVSHDDIIRVKLYHFLKTNYDNINIVSREVKQTLSILVGKRLWINSITVPSDNICSKLVISTILFLIKYFSGNIIFKILHRIRLLILLTQHIVNTLLLN